MAHVAKSIVFVVALALTAAGCATYAWQKPGVTTTQAERDAEECSQLARHIASDFELSLWASRPWPGRWHPGSPWSYDDWDLGPSRLELERRAADRCMESRGYRLVKLPKSSESASPRTD